MLRNIKRRESSNAYIDFLLGDFNTVLLEANKELLGVELSVTVVRVKSSEGSAEGSHGGGAAGIELLSELVKDYQPIGESG